jgi:hypothetical protein
MRSRARGAGRWVLSVLLTTYLVAIVAILTLGASSSRFSTVVKFVDCFGSKEYELRVLMDAMTCMGLPGDALLYHHHQDERRAECSRVAREISRFVWRTRRPYCWLRECGPWLEDIWEGLANGPFDNFGPFVPVFFPWMKLFAFSRGRYRRTVFRIFGVLAPNFLYVTVSGNADGIEGENMPNGTVPRNLFILSQGGKGHVPMLMWLRELTSDGFPIPADYDYVVVFLGTIRGPVRATMKEAVEAALPDRSFVGLASNWRSITGGRSSCSHRRDGEGTPTD